MSVKDMAADERGEWADFLETLSEQQWASPSLCDGWTVREVVAHAIGYDELGWPGGLGVLARNGFSLTKANANRLAVTSKYSPDRLVALLRRYRRPRGLTSALGGLVALVDGTIHHQDIRRPLGLPREIPADRLRTTLGLALKARPIHASAHVRGLTVVASDVDWTHGSGPEVRGPGEALLMAMAGRTHALPELTGPGVETLAERIRPK